MIASELKPFEEIVSCLEGEADGIVVLSCGVGVQTVAAAVEKLVHPATNSVYVGGFAGLWRADGVKEMPPLRNYRKMLPAAGRGDRALQEAGGRPA